MNVVFVAKKVTLTDDFKQKAEKKLIKIEKVLQDPTVNVAVTAIKDMAIVELTIKNNNYIFRAEKSAVDKLDALDDAVDTIIRQIRKNKTRLEKKLNDWLRHAADVLLYYRGLLKNWEEDQFDVVKYKKFNLKPMDVTEAILQMNLLGHTFFMYRDAQTNDVNVVYRRKDGNYAVLESEM